MASTMGIIVCELGRYPFIFLTITVIGCFLNILSVVHLVLLLLIVTIRHNLLLRLVCPSFLLCSFLGSCLLPRTQFFLRVLLLQLLLLRKRWWLLLFCLPARTRLHLFRTCLAGEVTLTTHC